MKQKGNFSTLAQSPLKTWKGWVIYYWDMSFSCMLFDKRPLMEKIDGVNFGYDTKGANEGISPYFLQACGITVPFDVTDEAGQEFYYGKECYHGEHPPIAIELTLPEMLLEQLRLI